MGITMRQQDFEDCRHLRGAVRAVLLGIAALGVFGALPVSADVEFGAQLGVGHSDNISRVAEQEIDETIGTAGVDLIWREQRQRFNSDVRIDLTHLNYFDDTYESEVVGTADANLVFSFLPERFTWLVQDSFGQALADPFVAITPETRENVNYFTTGPDVIFRLGSTGGLRFFGRYSAVEYEDSLLDSERTLGGASLIRELSQRSQIALNGVTENIEFDDLLGADYDRRHAYLSYDMQGARSEIGMELGYTWLDRASGEASGGALARLELTRNISASSALALSAGTQLTDSSDVLRAGASNEPVIGGVGITASADPFENRFASLEWRFNRNRTEFNIGASWNDDLYDEQSEFDRTRWVYGASLTRQLSRAVSLNLLADVSDESFEAVDLDAEELRGAVTLSWMLGSNIGLSLLAERIDRNTSTGAGEFVENRAFLNLFYRSLPAEL